MSQPEKTWAAPKHFVRLSGEVMDTVHAVHELLLEDDDTPFSDYHVIARRNRGFLKKHPPREGEYTYEGATQKLRRILEKLGGHMEGRNQWSKPLGFKDKLEASEAMDFITQCDESFDRPAQYPIVLGSDVRVTPMGLLQKLASHKRYPGDAALEKMDGDFCTAAVDLADELEKMPKIREGK
jgi:hypothetical protein